MPDDTTIKFVLQDESGGAPASGSGGQSPGGTLPGWQGQYEAVRFGGGAIPPPPDPSASVQGPLGRSEGRQFGAGAIPEAPPAAGLSPQASLISAINQLRGAIQGEGGPQPPPAPPPVQGQPEEGGASVPPWMEQVGGSFAASAVARGTGSVTMGTGAGVLAQKGIGALARSGPVGIAIAGAVTGLVVGGTAVKEVFDKLVDVTDRAVDSIAGLSPDVAQAKAGADVAHLGAMLRRSDTAGSELAAYTRARSDLSVAIEDLKTTLIRDIAPLLTKVIEVGADSVDTGHAMVETGKEMNTAELGVIGASLGAIAGLIPGGHGTAALGTIMAIWNRRYGEVKRNLEEIRDKRDDLGSTMEQWEDFFTKISPEWNHPANIGVMPPEKVPQQVGIF